MNRDFPGLWHNSIDDKVLIFRHGAFMASFILPMSMAKAKAKASVRLQRPV
jgi:hypothetical protein